MDFPIIKGIHNRFGRRKGKNKKEKQIPLHGKQGDLFNGTRFVRLLNRKFYASVSIFLFA